MTKQNKTKGFTLIELLVVIAIIGILSGIVLVSLSTARSKATDAKIKGQLASIRSAAEVFSSNNNNSYSVTAGSNEVCNPPVGDPSGLFNLLLATNYSDGTAPTCTDTATQWSAYHVESDGASYYCVDNSGNSKEYKGGTGWSAPTGGGQCP